jgi:hypothetical protein
MGQASLHSPPSVFFSSFQQQQQQQQQQQHNKRTGDPAAAEESQISYRRSGGEPEIVRACSLLRLRRRSDKASRLPAAGRFHTRNERVQSAFELLLEEKKQGRLTPASRRPPATH